MFCGFDAEIENVTTTKHTHTYNNNWNVTIALRNFLNHQKIPLGYYKCKQIIAACALITQKQRDIMQQRSTECLYVCMYEAHEKWNVARLNTNKSSSSSHNNNKESIANKLLPRWLAACQPACLPAYPFVLPRAVSCPRQGVSVAFQAKYLISTAHTPTNTYTERERRPGKQCAPWNVCQGEGCAREPLPPSPIAHNHLLRLQHRPARQRKAKGKPETHKTMLHFFASFPSPNKMYDLYADSMPSTSLLL